MNPLFVVPLLAYTLAATLWPGQVDGRRRGRALLIGEALFVIAALVLGELLTPLARPSADGLWWGRAGLLATAYLYVSGRGIVLIRGVLELPTLQMRRDEDRTAGAIDVARGRAVGSLERALALTMVLLGDYAAVGWIIAASPSPGSSSSRTGNSPSTFWSAPSPPSCSPCWSAWASVSC